MLTSNTSGKDTVYCPDFSWTYSLNENIFSNLLTAMAIKLE